MLLVIAIIGIITSLSLLAYSSFRQKARDTRRVKDIEQIQSALKLYFYNESSYPETLNFGQALIGSTSSTTYMAILPNNPGPWGDSGCSDSDYSYQATASSSDYALGFCLSTPVGNLSAGPKCATSKGIENSTCFGYREKITINHAKVSGDISSFQLYINLSDLDDNFWSHVQNGGGDIRIKSANGTEHAREVVSCDTATKTGEVHALIPNLSSATDTEIYIHYGDSNATDYAPSSTYGSQAVWSGYSVVQHLNNLTDTTTLDSTANAKNGTKRAINEPTEASGKIGQGQTFDGSDDYIRVPSVNITSGSFSISGWIKPVNPPDYTTLAGFDGSRRILVHPSGKALAQFNGNFFSNQNTTINSWNKITYVYNSGTNKEYFYINGNYDNEQAISYSTPLWSQNFYLGQYGETYYILIGSLDEFSVTPRVLSAAEIQTSYNNENDPSSFYTVGTEEIQ